MSLQHSFDIERMDAAEQAVPDDGDDQRRDEKLRILDQCRRRRHALARRSLEHAPDELYPGRDHLAMIELGDGGEACALGDEELEDALPFGAEHLGAEHLKE